MTRNFTVDCTCGNKVVIDSDTMRKVETVEAPILHDRHSTGFHDPLCSCGNCPGGAQVRRVSLVDEYTLGDWDGGDAA